MDSQATTRLVEDVRYKATAQRFSHPKSSNQSGIRAKKLRTLALLSLLILLVLTGTVQAQNTEKVAFSTFTPTGHTNLLLSTGPRSEINTEAILTLPTAAQKRHPIVVVVPGAGGHSEDHLRFWRARLLTAGIGVVALDPIRIRKLAPDQSERLSTAADLVDAFRVLEALSANPLVDPDRVAILGFSRGGLTAWESHAEAFKTAVLGAPSGLRFAAHAALYPPCHYTHIEQRVAPGPILFVLAAADARTPPEHCQSLAEVVSALGYNTQVTVIGGAQHAFDYFVPVFQDPNGFSSKGCRPLVVDTATPYPRPVHLDDGSPLVAGDGPAPILKILEWVRQCRRPTVALTGNQKDSEREEAASAVVAFLGETLKP